MLEFFQMGGYGLYVWLSYAAVAVVLFLNVWVSVMRHRRLKKSLRVTIKSDSTATQAVEIRQEYVDA